jgi:hypothetical protein
MTATPNPQVCPVKAKLIADLQSAHTWAIAVGNQEAEAVIRGDLQAHAALAGALLDAREKRQAAMDALKMHIREHGC